jgi:hypothetical protein
VTDGKKDEGPLRGARMFAGAAAAVAPQAMIAGRTLATGTESSRDSVASPGEGTLAASVSPAFKPMLQIAIDTEEEFDWFAPFRRDTMSVKNIACQELAQTMFERHRVVPIYLVDYPVASQPEAYEILREWAAGKRCEIGTHLQPWVNPPFDEITSDLNSFPGNLPPALERQKLIRLTETIEENFGIRPVVYRAGRYGIGAATAKLLGDLGYEVDTSILPGADLRSKQGPDFRSFDARPFWHGHEGGLLSIPLTVGEIGLLAGSAFTAQTLLSRPWAAQIKATAIASRLGVFSRIRLTPEGYTLGEQKQLVRRLLANGVRIFNLSYHSSSLLPGATQYVRSTGDRDRFLATLDAFLDFFLNELGGEVRTPTEIRRHLLDYARKPRPAGA